MGKVLCLVFVRCLEGGLLGTSARDRRAHGAWDGCLGFVECVEQKSGWVVRHQLGLYCL